MRALAFLFVAANEVRGLAIVASSGPEAMSSAKAGDWDGLVAALTDAVPAIAFGVALCVGFQMFYRRFLK